MLKRDLIDQLSEKRGLTKSESKDVIEDIFELIRKGLKNDRQVKLTGFGTLELANRKGRVAKNPQTGKDMAIEPGVRVRFKVSKKLKESL